MPDLPDLRYAPKIASIGVGPMPVVGTDTWPMGDRWSLHVYGYRATLTRGEEVVQLEPGMITLTPPQTFMTFGKLAVPGEHLFCTFRAVMADGAPPRPLTIPPHAATPLLRDRFAAAVSYHPHSPDRAVVRLWDILWDLADWTQRREQEPAMGSRILAQDAASYIELHLQTPLLVADVAAALGVSHNHLTRVFRQTFGCTVIGHIRRRRVERARILLSQTDMSVKAIAFQVGFQDAHQFNKAVRRELGRSPTAVRQQPLPDSG